jgi:FKBP-type peptidyl-prolyl cis-trans isomerase (trigger factor)
MPPNEKELFEKNIQREAKEAITLFYLSNKIIEDAKITFTKEEIEKEALKMLMEKKPSQKPELKNITEEMKAASLSILHLKKAQGFILTN